MSTKRRVDLNNTVYCHLWSFKKGVVYLSPKPHQIRIAFQHFKHTKLASVAVIEGTRSKTPCSCITWPWRC